MSLATDPRQQLSEMSQCAYRLGMAFGREAERLEGWAQKREYFELFERCFFAVRVATALQLRLGRAPATAGLREGREDPSLRAERDPRERDRDVPEPRERDREGDREIERASLPLLLRTLNGVAADAAALPGPAPAELPTLRELLARMTPQSGAAAAPRPSPTGLRARLSGAATVMTLAPPWPAAPAVSLRQPTGPPPSPPRHRPARPGDP